MQAEYRRDLQKNELIIEVTETEEDGYSLRMAEQNQIAGLLSFRSARRDGILYLHYDITARQSLEQVFAKRLMEKEDLLFVLSGISTLLEELQKYLLNPAHLVFEPGYIFTDGSQKEVHFCYLPGEEHKDSILELAEFLLKKLDHEDWCAVEIGYRFYQDALEDNFSLKKTLNKLLFEVKNDKQESYAHQQDIRKKDEAQFSDQRKEKWDQEKQNEQRYTENRSASREDTGKTGLTRKTGKKPQIPDSAKKNLADRIFQAVHPAVLLSGLFLLVILELLFYIRMINITEAGGLFFLLTAAEVLINQCWLRMKEKKQSLRQEEWTEEDSEEEYQDLLREMYPGRKTAGEERYRDSKKENQETRSDSEDEIEETRCFVQTRIETRLRLVCISAEHKDKKPYPDIELESGQIRIGKRKGESDVILDSPTVSRVHAQLEAAGGRFYVRDSDSKNGTFLNGRKLDPQEVQELSAGDTIAFAEIEYLVYFARNQ